MILILIRHADTDCDCEVCDRDKEIHQREEMGRAQIIIQKVKR